MYTKMIGVISCLLFIGMVHAGYVDPTKPSVLLESSKSQDTELGLDVEMIFTGKDGSSAIINGRKYHEGDMVGQYLVEDIYPGGVVLTSGSSQLNIVVSPALNNGVTNS